MLQLSPAPPPTIDKKGNQSKQEYTSKSRANTDPNFGCGRLAIVVTTTLVMAVADIPAHIILLYVLVNRLVHMCLNRVASTCRECPENDSLGDSSMLHSS